MASTETTDLKTSPGSGPAATAAQAPGTSALDHGPEAHDRIEPYVWKIAGVVILGMIMSILDTTIVNVALRHARPRSAQLDLADPVGRDRLPARAGGRDPR